jgi:heme exporter protein D
MQELLFESPVMITLCGLFTAGLAAFSWTQIGHKALLWSAVGLALATALLTLVSVQVVTDREQLTQTLNDVANALQRNDHQYVFAQIHPNAAATVRQAKAELPNYHFTEARVTRIKSIVIDSAQKPESAVAEFNVRVTVKLRDMERGQPIPRFVKVYFAKQDGRWLVRDYEHADPRAGFTD